MGGLPASSSGPMTWAPTGNWQDVVALRLDERDAREKSHDEMIRRYSKLAAHTRTLHLRNQSLLQAAGIASSSSKNGGPGGSGDTKAASSKDGGSGQASTSSFETVGSSSVQQAYLASLESQLSSTRQELASAYKSQSENAQRLLSLNEQLRERQEASKTEAADVKHLKQETDRALRRERDLKDAAVEKDKVIEMLQDELRTLSLELNQVETRNDDLKRDNANLLQRWLDRARDEAERFNEANHFLEEIERRKKEAATTPATASGSKESKTPGSRSTSRSGSPRLVLKEAKETMGGGGG